MLRRTLSVTSTLMAARFFGAALTFATQILVSRWLGPAALGEFLILVAAIGIISVLLPFGFQALSQYFVAAYDHHDQRDLQRGFLITAYRVTLTASTVLAIGGSAGAALSVFTPIPFAPDAILIVAASAPAAALLTLGSGVAVALKRPYLALLPDMIGKPAAVAAAAAGLAAAAELTPARLAACLGAALWLLVALQGAAIGRTLASRTGAKPPSMSEARRWWRFAPAWLIVILLGEFTVDLNLLLLGALMPAEQLGVVGAAMRIFALLGFALTASHAVASPAVFAAGRDRGEGATPTTLAGTQEEALDGAVAQANLTATFTAAACLGGSIAFGAAMLALFGPGFAAAETALVILAASLVVKAALGPAALILSLFDRPYACVPALLAAFAALVTLDILLVPAYGINGAAAALSIAGGLGALLQWLVVWRVTGRNIALRPADLKRLPGLLARPA